MSHLRPVPKEQGDETRTVEKEVAQALALLARALPEGHPARAASDALIRKLWGQLNGADETVNAAMLDVERMEQDAAAYDRLVTMLGDWRRGIRDWAEVEALL